MIENFGDYISLQAQRGEKESNCAGSIYEETVDVMHEELFGKSGPKYDDREIMGSTDGSETEDARPENIERG